MNKHAKWLHGFVNNIASKVVPILYKFASIADYNEDNIAVEQDEPAEVKVEEGDAAMGKTMTEL